MAIDLTPEQRQTGTDNYVRTTEGLTRRGFMQSMAAAAGGAAVAASAAVYFKYESPHGRPVQTALIGAGDEGGVLVGEHNPEFMEFVAVCDIRPSNQKRIFEGEPTGLRKGFKRIYGGNAEKQIHKYTGDYKEMLRNEKDVEAVVIAAPLCWHAKMAIDAMKIGQERGRPIHVLCEKLMGWNVKQCKQMIQTAEDTKSILSIGHQRHYSLLYAHAVEILKAGVLGDVKYISALWHRNNAWPFKPNDDQLKNMVKEVVQPFYKDGWFNPVLAEDYDALNNQVQEHGFDNVEQLIRWRCHNATGGGLMAELGSHQMDACSIFLGHVHPLSVIGVGGKNFYGRPPSSGETNSYGDFRTNYNDRDSEDQVFLTYEFPGPNHPHGPNHGTDEDDIVVVTYSSVNTNQFETYGECVMGTRGTMIVDREASVLLYPEKNPALAGPADARAITATVDAGGKGKPALDSSSTWGAAVSASAPGAGPTGGSPGGVVSRGYREEMEDFAYCVRRWDGKVGYARDDKGEYKQRLPLCHGAVAMVDAIIALTANRAMRGPEPSEEERKSGKPRRPRPERIEFKADWFDATKLEALPDGDTTEKIPV